jgi:hypothetical protein
MTISERIYQNEIAERTVWENLPNKSDFVKKAIADYKATAVGTFNELESGIADVKKKAKEDYAGLREKSLQACRDEREAIKKTIFEESSCSSLPPHSGEAVFDIIWSEAYERGHYAGMCEVYNEFVRLDSMFAKISKVLSEKKRTTSKNSRTKAKK